MNLALAPAPSWYEASVKRPLSAPPLFGDTTADVCVVGAGIAGCSTAMHLAERGFKVVLLEAEQAGFGASGRSGGQLLPGYASSQQKLTALIGRDNARRLWDFTLEGVDLVRERVRRHSIDCNLAWGHMNCAVKPGQIDYLREEHREFEEEYGYRSTRFMERAEVEGLLATSRYCAGLYDSAAGHCHPLKYALGIAAATKAAGVHFYESSRVTAIERGPTVIVRTANGSVRAKHVALCANVGLGELAPTIGRKAMGVATYIVATRQLGAERATALIRNNMAVSDVNWVLDYFLRSADHRLLFGGRVSYSGIDPVNTANATRLRMLRVFPQLADAEIEYAWGGFVDITMNRAPHFGRLDPNLYFLQGFSGHGLVLTGIAGKIVAEAIAGQAERFDIYTRIRHHDFPGGLALRRPALVLAMLWYRMKDLLP